MRTAQRAHLKYFFDEDSSFIPARFLRREPASDSEVPLTRSGDALP